MKKFGAPGDEAGNASGAGGPPQPGQEPQVASHVEILKALADPLRLNMLYALTRGRSSHRQAKTVKELAAELGEPQTKLYRHIKHLESAGLIQSVSSRVVSGIVEHRYQASDSDMVMGDDLTDREKVSPEAEAMAAAALDLYRRQFFAARRARPADQAADAAEPHRRMVLAIADGEVPAARAAAIYDLLYQLLDEVADSRRTRPADSSDEEMIPINLLLGYFSDDQSRD
jgi:DNA-binding transcriptional ArsR family regulator